MHIKHTLGNGTKINGKTNVEKTPRKIPVGEKIRQSKPLLV
jgi:hypothetical protein